jgi:hypothetical protein
MAVATSPRTERDRGRRVPWLGLLAFVLAGLGLPPAPATGGAGAYPITRDAAVDCVAMEASAAARTEVCGEAAVVSFASAGDTDGASGR